MAKLGNAIVFVGVDITGLNRGLGEAQKNFKRHVGNLQGLSRTIGKSMLGASAAIAGGLGAAVKAASNFDLAMTESTSIMTGLSDELKASMESTARSLAKESKFGADELAKAYYHLASSGLDAKQSIAALPQVAAFATAGAFDLETATALLTDAQSALGMKFADAGKNLQEMTRLSDVLTQANNAASGSVQDFSEALTNKAAAALRMVNKDAEEGVAVLMSFADQGIKGSEAGSALGIVMRDLQTKFLNTSEGGMEKAREKLTQVSTQLKIAEQKYREMTKSGKTATSTIMAQSVKIQDLREKYATLKEGLETTGGAIKQFGVAVYDDQGNMRNMGDIIGDLEKALAGMSDEQKKATLLAMGFSDKSVAFTQVLIGTSAKIKEYEASLRGAGGATKEVAEKQMQAFANQMLMLKNQLVDVGITLGQQLIPVLMEMVKAVTPVIESIAQWIQTHPDMAKYLGFLAGALAVGGVLLVGIGMVSAAFPGIGLAITGIVGAAGIGWMIGTWIGKLIDWFGPLGRALDAQFDKWFGLFNLIKKTLQLMGLLDEGPKLLANTEAVKAQRDAWVNSEEGKAARAQGAADMQGAPPGFAAGTLSAPRGLALVGERGPELVRMRGGEQVIPAGQTARAMGGVTVNLHVHNRNVTEADAARIAGLIQARQRRLSLA